MPLFTAEITVEGDARKRLTVTRASSLGIAKKFLERSAKLKGATNIRECADPEELERRKAEFAKPAEAKAKKADAK